MQAANVADKKLTGFGGLLFGSGIFVGQRFFKQRQLPLHDLQVINFRDGVALVLYRVLVVAGSVVAAAQRIKEAGRAGIAALVEFDRAVRIANRLLKIALG